MFRVVYIKLRNFYNLTCQFYTSIITEHPTVSIVCYLLLMVIFGFGLFQIHFNADNEILTLVRNSQVLQDAAKIRQLFPEDQSKRFFSHQLTDLGHYFEFIILLKYPNDIVAPENNCDLLKNESLVNKSYLKKFTLVNKTLIEEYNAFYDSILRIKIEDSVENQTRFYNFSELCAKRLNKCAVEGGIMRAQSWQNNLYDGGIEYDKDDPIRAHVDTEAVDGTSVDFVFGSCRKDTCDTWKCKSKDIMLIRNRFDLLARTQKEKELAIRFMHTFADFMQNITTFNNHQYPYFDFSFHTSHTLETEIRKYSLNDVYFVFLTFISFWLVYFLLIFIDISTGMKDWLNSKMTEKQTNDLEERRDGLDKLFSLKYLCINSCGLFALVSFVQFIFTLVSSLGMLFLVGISANQLLYTVLFVLMVNGGNQSLLLYKSINKKEMLVLKQSNNAKLINDDFENRLRERLTKAVQKILVPRVFGLLAAIVAYSVISLSSPFDFIRIYSIFLIICLSFNLIGQLFFFTPCLILHMKRVNQNRNCIFVCLKHELKQPSADEIAGTQSQPVMLDESTDMLQHNFNKNNSSTITTTTVSVSSPVDLKSNATITRNKHAKHKKYLLILYALWFKKLDYLFKTKIKYLIFLLFLAYLVFNLTICCLYSKTNLPLGQLMPVESYLSRHLKIHNKYFEIGPIVMLNFMNMDQRGNSSIKQLFETIDALKTDLKKLRGMRAFDMNGFDGLKKSIEAENQFQDDKCHWWDEPCFFKGLESLRVDYRDDFVFNSTAKEIFAHRAYLQYRHFDGLTTELDLWHSLTDLAQEKYNFTKHNLIIYSSVFVYLEQLAEIVSSTVSMFVLSLESMFLVGLLFLFDIKSLLLLLCVVASFLLSLLSNLFLFGISLNVVTLFHLVIVPCFIVEFFYSTAYLFLFNAVKPNKQIRSISSNVESTSQTLVSSPIVFQSSSLSPKKLKLNHVKFVFESSTQTSAIYLLTITLCSLIFMSFCTTYNFHTLFAILTSTCVNIFLHITLFYPSLLILFGTCWPKTRTNRFKRSKRNTGSDLTKPNLSSMTQAN